MDKFIEDVQKILNETKEENLKEGDIVYIRGDYGLYDDKYVITKITDSHDEEISSIESGAYLFKPEKEAEPIVVLKDIKTEKFRAYKLQPDNPYYADPIELASDIDSLGVNTLDLNELAEKLKAVLRENGIDTDLEITRKEEKGKVFPKLEIDGKTNLVDQVGIWKYAVKNIVLDSWGSSYVSTKEKKIIFDLHFSYDHTNGGSNGAKMGRAFYDLENKNWFVELGERK